MQPLHELLNRIKWDAGFGRADFALGYWDHDRAAETVVPVGSVEIDMPGRRFTCRDADGVEVSIPFHRVRSVYKDGQAIWSRPLKHLSDSSEQA